MRYRDLPSLGNKGCSDLLSRARATMSRLKSLSDILIELASAIKTESEAAQMNLEAVKNMCGLTSLPNELLSRIFECAVNDATLTIPNRWKAAVTLSHVCQSFRETALSCPHNWTSISRSDAMAASCLSRSKDLPLEVELIVGFGSSDDPHELRFEQLLPDILSHSNRWRHLDVRFLSISGDDDAVNRMPLSGSDIRQAFREVDAPSLKSLRIWNFPHGNSFYGSYADFVHWNAPNLRHVTSVHYFPFGLENISSLDITLIINQINLSDLLNGLSRMHALEDFTLELERCSELFDPGDLQPNERTELPSVRRLRIETEYVHERGEVSALLKCALFSSLFFPGAVDLHVGLKGIMSEILALQGLRLDAEVAYIFRHVEQFPRVERFHLEVFGRSAGRLNVTSKFVRRVGGHYHSQHPAHHASQPEEHFAI